MQVKCDRKPNFIEFVFWVVSMIFRPVWSFILCIVFGIHSLVLYLTSKKVRGNYKYNKFQYKNINSLVELIFWAKNIYKYVWDDFGSGFLRKEKLRGWLDHDGTQFEFFVRGGDDCDGIALMVKRKLKQLGYDAVRVNIVSENNIKTGHFDCLFFDSGIKSCCLFNYGVIRYGDTVQMVFQEFGRWWFTYSGAYYFKWWF